MQCKFCKTENPDKALFCCNCANSLVLAAVWCPDCGLSNKSDARFCNGCGANLITGKVREWIPDDRYKIINTIKKGAMGAVYRAFDQRLGIGVAVKKLFNNGGNADDIKKQEEMFKREAEILASLNHPNLPKVSDYFSAPDETGKISNFLVMSLIDGEDMESYLAKKKPPLPLKEASDYLLKIMDILEYLHSLSPPVIYRDLKPSNIMLGNKNLYLVDFGIAKFFEEKKTGTMMGTAGYASPDQCRGNDNPSNDIYSLGVLTHYLLTGKDPQDPDRPMFTFEPVSLLNPEIPPHLNQLIASMTEMRMSDRPGSIPEVREIFLNGRGKAEGNSHSGRLISKSDYFKAVIDGDLQKVITAIEQGLGIQEKDKDGIMPYHYAAYSGNIPVLEYLRDKGAYPEVKDDNGKTPLHWACAGKAPDGVEFLIRNGAILNPQDKNLVTPAHIAVSSGNIQALRGLIKWEADLDRQDNEKWTPLHIAVKKNDINAVKALIEGGASVNIAGKNQKTPLILAAANGNEQIVKYLVKKGADILMKDKKGNTAITWADINGHKAITEFLNRNISFFDKLIG